MSKLYQLPDGWEWKKLGDVTSLVGGGTPSRNVIEYWENGNIVWLSPTDLGSIGEVCSIASSKDRITKLGLEKSSARLLPIGTVLFSSRATIGKIAINTIELTTNQGFTNFICEDSLNNQYLAYCLVNFTKEITTLSNSTTFKEVSKSALKELEIPVPPLTEQKRIVQKLDALFERIDKAIALLQKNIDAADNFMNSVLNDVFSDLEQNYKKYKLTEIANLVDGDRGSNYPQKSEFFENEYCLFLSTKNVTKNGFMFIKNQFITKEKDEVLRRGKLNRNDLIITTRGTIGNIAIYDESVEYDNVRINSGMAIIRIMDLDKIYNRFLYKYLFSPQFIAFLDDIQSGSAQPQISLTNLKESEFSIPPLKIQQKVVAYLDNISVQLEQVKSAQQQKKQNLLDLKSSILDQAFHGKL